MSLLLRLDCSIPPSKLLYSSFGLLYNLLYFIDFSFISHLKLSLQSALVIGQLFPKIYIVSLFRYSFSYVILYYLRLSTSLDIERPVLDDGLLNQLKMAGKKVGISGKPKGVVKKRPEKGPRRGSCL